MGWISSAENWIEMRALSNKLVHEYMNSTSELLHALILALESSEILMQTQQRLAKYAIQLQQKISC